MSSSSSRSPLAASLYAALFASCVISAHAAAGDFAYYIDRDSGGGALYGGAPVWVASASKCQIACSADPNCYGWTFSIPSNPTWNGPCYLKGTNNCDATSLNKVQATGKYASGVISNSCAVTCNGIAVSVPSANCAVVKPSQTPSAQANRYKRDMAARESSLMKKSLCPRGLQACSIGSSDGYECVKLSEELENCGACGNDCTRIPGVKNVRCSQGQCIVSQCRPGYWLNSLANGSCERSPRKTRSESLSNANLKRHQRRTVGL